MLTSEPRPAQPFCDAQWRSTRARIRVERLLTDNAKISRCCHVFRAIAAELRLKQRFTRPRRPQTNG
jgi:transposase InsO family protein